MSQWLQMHHDNLNNGVYLPEPCHYSDASFFVWPEPDSTPITNMGIPTVLSSTNVITHAVKVYQFEL